jgi:hypothetical protein
MTPLDAIYAASMVDLRAQKFRRQETHTRRYVSPIFRRGRGVKKFSSD